MADALVLHGSAIQNMDESWRSCAATRRWRPTIRRRRMPNSRKSRAPTRFARTIWPGHFPWLAIPCKPKRRTTGRRERSRRSISAGRAGRSAAPAAKSQDARAEFEKLRVLAADADLDMPVFQRLRPLADAMSLPADWPHCVNSLPTSASDLISPVWAHSAGSRLRPRVGRCPVPTAGRCRLSNTTANRWWSCFTWGPAVCTAWNSFTSSRR